MKKYLYYYPKTGDLWESLNPNEIKEKKSKILQLVSERRFKRLVQKKGDFINIHGQCIPFGGVDKLQYLYNRDTKELLSSICRVGKEGFKKITYERAVLIAQRIGYYVSYNGRVFKKKF